MLSALVIGQLILFSGTSCKRSEHSGDAPESTENEMDLSTIGRVDSNCILHSDIVSTDELAPFDSSQSVALLTTGDDAANVVFGEQFEGPVALVFWGIWCHSCHEQLEALSAWQDENPAEADDLHIVAVANDGEEFATRAIQMAREERWPFPILLPTDAQKERWNPENLTPTTVLLDDAHTPVWRIVGFGRNERAALLANLVATPCEL